MSHEALRTWSEQLAELAALGGQLCNAIEARDVVAAIAATTEMRRVRCDLSRVAVPDLTSDCASRDHATAIADTAELALGARTAELAMEQWLERELPPPDVLLASPLGIASYADAMLPPAWDYARELIVLVGDELVPVADVLVALGQRRVVVVTNAASARATDGAVLHVVSVDELAVAIRTMIPNPPTTSIVRGAPGTASELVAAAASTTHDALSDLRVHGNTVRAFSRTWIEQGAANIPALARVPSIAALDDAFVGVPMVIAAPGPSLARNVEQLRALRGRAVITAFSHSLRPLLAAGVTPDLVITVDPQDVRYHFAGCDVSQSFLLNGATAHPSLFDLPARGCFSLSANSALERWLFDGLGEDASVASGGSVATCAYSLALRWRCDPIVFVGLDLSFPGGAYYIASSHDGNAHAEIRDGVMRVAGWSDGFAAMKRCGGPSAATERVIELPGWGGGTVPSGFMFGMFHRWFVERTRHVGSTTVYNCTEGGAFIEGMRHTALANLTWPDEIDVAARLARVSVDDSRAARMSAHLADYARRLRRARALARRTRSLIARGERGPTLDRVERALAATLAPLGVVSILTQRAIDQAYDRAWRPGQVDDYVAASDELLAVLAGVIDELEPILAEARQRLAADGSQRG